MMKLAFKKGSELQSDTPHYITPNHLAESKTVFDQEDTSVSPLRVNIFDVNEPENGILLARGDEPLIERFDIVIDSPGAMREAVVEAERLVWALRDECYEIWDHGHNVNDYHEGGFHLADAEHGPVSYVLDGLRATIKQAGRPLVQPEYNHDKFSVKKHDNTAVNGIHVDSFEGMRTEPDGRRKKIWRYFFNLSTMPRYTLIAPLNPDDVAEALPIEWNETYLDPIFHPLNAEIDMLRIGLAPADYTTGRLNVYRTTTTHLPHAEYGYIGDSLAVVDSID